MTDHAAPAAHLGDASTLGRVAGNGSVTRVNLRVRAADVPGVTDPAATRDAALRGQGSALVAFMGDAGNGSVTTEKIFTVRVNIPTPSADVPGVTDHAASRDAHRVTFVTARRVAVVGSRSGNGQTVRVKIRT